MHRGPSRHHLYLKIVGVLSWAAQVRPDLQSTTKDHTRHLASPTEWDWQHLILKHSLRYLQGMMHYRFLTSPTNSRTFTTLHQVLKPTFTPPAFASVTACTSINYFKNFNIIYNFGNLDAQYNHTISTTSSTTTRSLTSSKSPIHIFTDSTSALSLSNKLGLNKRSKHIALQYLFVQDAQATGLVKTQWVTSHSNPSDIYATCASVHVFERHLRHNGIIELHIKRGAD